MAKTTAEIMASWGPVANAYAKRAKRRFFREELHKSGWIIAGIMMILTLADLFLRSTIQNLECNIYIIATFSAIIVAFVYGLFVTFRRTCLGKKLNGAKAGLISGCFVFFAIEIGLALSKISFIAGLEILFSGIAFLIAITISITVEAINTAEEKIPPMK